MLHLNVKLTSKPDSPQNSDYNVIGKLVAMSIVQGGPGFPVMLPAAFNYLTTHQYIGQLVKDSDVPDPFVLELLSSTCTF